MRDIIVRTDELDHLYRSFGYYAYLEREGEKLFGALDDLEVTIPDSERFQRTLDKLLAEIASNDGVHQLSGSYSGFSLPRFFYGSEGLFPEIVEARWDEQRLVALLRRDPDAEFGYGLEGKAIARLPRDPNTFTKALSDLENQLRHRWRPESGHNSEAVFAAISELRLAVARQDSCDGFAIGQRPELPTVRETLKSLQHRLVYGVYRAGDDEAEEKKAARCGALLVQQRPMRLRSRSRPPSWAYPLIVKSTLIHRNSTWPP